MSKLYINEDRSIPDEVMHVDTAKAIFYLSCFFSKTKDPRTYDLVPQLRAFLGMIQELIPQHKDEIREYGAYLVSQDIQYTIEGLLLSGEKINAYKNLIERKRGWGNYSLIIKTQGGPMVDSLNAWIDYYTKVMRSDHGSLFPVYKPNNGLYIRGPDADKDRKRMRDAEVDEEMLQEEFRRQYHGKYDADGRLKS